MAASRRMIRLEEHAAAFWRSREEAIRDDWSRGLFEGCWLYWRNECRTEREAGKADRIEKMVVLAAVWRTGRDIILTWMRRSRTVVGLGKYEWLRPIG